MPAGADEAFLADIPLGRAGSPEEVASVVAFPASGAAFYRTGATFAVGGGAFMP